MDKEDKVNRIKEETNRQKSNGNGALSPLARRGVLSLLGGTGLGIVESQPTVANPQRSWNQDVDAKGHTLSDLGALTMASNPAEITDFEGENLSIDNGVLNATATDGCIGESGEKIHLASIKAKSRTNVSGQGNYRITIQATRAISTDQLSFSNIAKTYLSLSGWAYGSENNTTSLRLYDKTTDTPILDSEVEIETEGKEDSVPIEIPFNGPKAEYKSTDPHLIHVQYKSTTTTEPDEFATIGGIMIHVWGEA